MRLTSRSIEQFSFAGTDPKMADIRWDDELPGFGVRVWPSGAKTFALRYRIDGRRRYLSLGSYGVLTLQQARDIARARLHDVLRGIDPLDEKRRRAYGETVAEVVDSYLDLYSKSEKDSYLKDCQQVRDYVKPILGRIKFNHLERADLVRMKDKIGLEMGKRVTANRVLALLSGVFGWAKDRGIVDKNATNPCERVDRFEEVNRERYVTEAEMPRLAKAIAAEQSPYGRTLIWLYLLLGLRRSELRRIKWADVEIWYDRKSRCNEGRLRIGKTKNGKPLYLPLVPAAVAMLEALDRVADNPYVFPGRRKGKHFVGVDNLWDRIRTAAGLEDVHLHDLRHTVGSWMTNDGVSLEKIGRILNHSNPRTTKRYAHMELSAVTVDLNRHTMRLLKAAKPKRVKRPKASASPDVIEVDHSSEPAPRP